MTGFNADQAAQYWKAHGPTLAPPDAQTDEHVRSEAALSALLLELDSKRHIGSVLDVGCGQGRIAALLGRVLPKAEYSGLDLARAQLEGTQKARPDGTFYLSRLQDFQPDRKWDLVLASEVLMHVPPTDIQQACDRMAMAANKWIVAVEWTQPVMGPIADWNWLYDYEDLFGPSVEAVPTDLQTIFAWRA